MGFGWDRQAVMLALVMAAPAFTGSCGSSGRTSASGVSPDASGADAGGTATSTGGSGAAAGSGGGGADASVGSGAGGTPASTGGAGGAGPMASSGGSGGALGDGSLTDSGADVALDAACGSTLAAARRDVSVLLVVDKSGSMEDQPTGFATDKWTALKTALGAVMDGTKADLAFGLELFPYPADPTNPIPVACTANCCEMPAAPGINVPIEAGATAAPKILSALAAVSPGGGTPTALALQRALDYFTTGAGQSLGGDRYVLLVTDGGPNCDATLSCTAASCTTNLDGECPLPSNGNCCDPQFGGSSARERCLDDAATTAKIQALGAAGIKTFVAGLPGSEPYASLLDALATAGGEVNPAAPPKYFAVGPSDGVAGLSEVVESLTKQLVSACRLELASVPPDLTRLNVEVDGALLPAGPNGWELDLATSPPTVVLAGTACAQASGAGSVRVTYGCPTVH